MRRSASPGSFLATTPVGGVRPDEIRHVRGVRPAVSGGERANADLVAGGTKARWRRDGKELFYISADGKLTAVPVTTDGAALSALAPPGLFDVEVPSRTAVPRLTTPSPPMASGSSSTP